MEKIEPLEMYISGGFTMLSGICSGGPKKGKFYCLGALFLASAIYLAYAFSRFLDWSVFSEAEGTLEDII